MSECLKRFEDDAKNLKSVKKPLFVPQQYPQDKKNESSDGNHIVQQKSLKDVDEEETPGGMRKRTTMLENIIQGSISSLKEKGCPFNNQSRAAAEWPETEVMARIGNTCVFGMI